MADEEMTGAAPTTAVADRPEVDDAPAPSNGDRGTKRKKYDDDDDLEYEIEIGTPFGSIEFEFEPQSKQEKKAAERKAKAEAAAAKKARDLARELARRAEREPKSGGPNKWLITLLVIVILGAAIIVAYWLFARPGEEDDEVPPEFANEPQPQGFVARIRLRFSNAIRAGRKASRDAQREEREKIEGLTGTPAND